MHHRLLPSLLLLGCTFAGAAPRDPAGVTVVDAPGLARLAADQPGLVVIDTRPALERRDGYIEDSVRLSEPRADCAALQRVAPVLTRPVAFYCDGVHCGGSSAAAAHARSCGYDRVYWFRGGFEEWVAHGYPFLRD